MVEMPLACVLPDRIQAILREVDEKRRAAEAMNTNVQPKLGFWATLGQFLTAAARTLLPASLLESPDVKFVINILSSSSQKSIAEAKNRSMQLATQKQRTLEAVKDSASAYTHVLTAFTSLQAKLDLEHEVSRLVH